MNRLGISNGSELEEVVKILKDNNIEIEGIYTHIYNALNYYKNDLTLYLLSLVKQCSLSILCLFVYHKNMQNHISNPIALNGQYLPLESIIL